MRKSSAGRGIKCSIAGAGGAAHLTGMMAAKLEVSRKTQQETVLAMTLPELG